MRCRELSNMLWSKSFNLMLAPTQPNQAIRGPLPRLTRSNRTLIHSVFFGGGRAADWRSTAISGFDARNVSGKFPWGSARNRQELIGRVLSLGGGLYGALEALYIWRDASTKSPTNVLRYPRAGWQKPLVASSEISGLLFVISRSTLRYNKRMVLK